MTNFVIARHPIQVNFADVASPIAEIMQGVMAFFLGSGNDKYRVPGTIDSNGFKLSIFGTHYSYDAVIELLTPRPELGIQIVGFQDLQLQIQYENVGTEEAPNMQPITEQQEIDGQLVNVPIRATKVDVAVPQSIVEHWPDRPIYGPDGVTVIGHERVMVLTSDMLPTPSGRAAWVVAPLNN